MRSLNFDFLGRVAFIFGGAGGIGKEIASAIGSRGGKICLFDINSELLSRAREELEGSGIWVRTYVTDITSYESVQESTSRALKESEKIDILVNGASIITRKSVFELSFKEWLMTISINLNGTFLACSILGKVMLENGYGRILNFSSQNSSGAMNNADYSASKAGIDSLTRSLAVEFREKNKDITVNAISPPPTITELWKKGRTEEQISAAINNGSVFRTDEMINVILFLCSEESGSISGQILSHKANLFRVPNR